jgi:hypothetical protein
MVLGNHSGNISRGIQIHDHQTTSVAHLLAAINYPQPIPLQLAYIHSNSNLTKIENKA